MNIDTRDLQPGDDQTVSRFVSILASDHFQITDNRYEPEAFGNLLVDMCSEVICCRLTRDRGEWIVYCRGASSEEWFYLALLRKVIDRVPVDADWTIEEQLGFLERHLQDIQQLLDPRSLESTERELQRIQIARRPQL